METQAFDTLALVHLMFLSMGGGVVATEAVIEVYPFRRPDVMCARTNVLTILRTFAALVCSVSRKIDKSLGLTPINVLPALIPRGT